MNPKIKISIPLWPNASFDPASVARRIEQERIRREQERRGEQKRQNGGEQK